MEEDPFRLEPNHQIIVAIVLIGLTLTAEATVLLSNASFVLMALGVSSLLIYLTAALCYMLLPWLAAHVPHGNHLHITRLSLLAFCVWIGSEETLHASHSYQTPEAVANIAGLVMSEPAAHQASRLFAICAMLGIIELLSIVHHHSICMLRHAQRELHGKNSREEEK